MGYNYKPRTGPQALYTPQKEFSYLTVDDIDGSQRALVRKFRGTISKPQTTSGDPFEVTGPLVDSQTIYFFGNPSPVLRKSTSGGTGSTDISPGSVTSLRPTLALSVTSSGHLSDDILIVDSNDQMQHYYGGAWTIKGTIPSGIVPTCGARSAFLGSEALLGRANPSGQSLLVLYTPNRGEAWANISAGLPTSEPVTITAFAGSGFGGEVTPPEVDSECPEIEIFRGRYWREKRESFAWPYVWDYDIDCGQYWWQRKSLSGNPWQGLTVPRMYVDNCVEYADGWKYDLNIIVYSHCGLAAAGIYGDAVLQCRQYRDREAAEKSWIRGEDDLYSDSTWSTGCKAEVIYSGSSTTCGPICVRYRCPVFYGTALRHKFSHPWLAFSLVVSSNRVWPLRSVDMVTTPCDGWFCWPNNWQESYAEIGERGYRSGPDGFSTWGKEFEYLFPYFHLGVQTHQCVGTWFPPGPVYDPTCYGHNYRYSTAWLGRDEGLGSFIFWMRYSMVDLGLGLIHIVGYN